MAGKPADPNKPRKPRVVKPRKNFLLYKASVNDAGQAVIDPASVQFTRDAMDLVTAIQRGDGTQFVEVQLKK